MPSPWFCVLFVQSGDGHVFKSSLRMLSCAFQVHVLLELLSAGATAIVSWGPCACSDDMLIQMCARALHVLLV